MRATKFIYGSGVALLLGYLLLSWAGIRAGLVSIDTYGVIRAVTERLQTGDFPMSRPPGHPLSELWMLPATAWIMDGGKVLSAETYGFYQLVGGLFLSRDFLAAFAGTDPDPGPAAIGGGVPGFFPLNF